MTLVNARNIASAFALTAALPVLAVAIAQTTPVLLEAAITPSTDPTVYAYEFTMTETGSRKMTVTARVEPAKPEGQRVTILDAKGEDLDLEEMDERLESNADGDIWCDNMIAGAEGPVTKTPVGSGLTAYRFTPKPRPDAEKDERKMFSQLTATATVDDKTQSLKGFKAVLGEPWKPNLLAKIHEFELSGECLAAPNGRAYAAVVTTRIRGSAVGQNFAANNVRRITKLDAAS